MSTPTEERYIDLKKLCDRVAPDLFDSLSWILIMNLDLIPEDDIGLNPNLQFSYALMYQKYKEADAIARSLSESENPISKRFKGLLKLDPDLSKTFEISQTFFALALRRIEIAEKLGIKKF